MAVRYMTDKNMRHASYAAMEWNFKWLWKYHDCVLDPIGYVILYMTNEKIDAL